MKEEKKANEMSTKNKINSLINDIQYRLNKRSGLAMYNQNKASIDLNVFQSFGPAGMPRDQNPAYAKSPPYQYNNYINNDNNIPSQSINDMNLRNIIKEEFYNLIHPFQTRLSEVDTKQIKMEENTQRLFNAQNLGNLNDNAKIIGTYLYSNISNDGGDKKSLEDIKTGFNSLCEEFKKKTDSLKNEIDSNKSDVAKSMETLEKKIMEVENENKNKSKNVEIKNYVEKNMFDGEVNDLNEKQNKIMQDYENNIRNLSNQIDNINRSISQLKMEINKINGLDYNLNSLRTDFGKITEDVSQIKYQVTPEIINKINSIDFNSLKQQVSQNEFKSLKDNVNINETNLNSIKTMAENCDKEIYDLKKKINNFEQKQTLANKNVESIQPLLNENVLEKIKDINGKIEELSKIKNDVESLNKKVEESNKNKEGDNNNQNNNEEKKEEEGELFIGGSRRQQRNNKSVNKSTNANANLDEKSLNLLKQLEKINLDELQKIDFSNILMQISDLSKENKSLSNKIEEQNKTISEINERIKNAKINSSVNNNLNLNLMKEKDPLSEFDLLNKEKNSYNFNRREVNKDFKPNILDNNNDPFSREMKFNDFDLNKKNSKNMEFDNILNNKDIYKSGLDKGNDKNNKNEKNAIDDEYNDFDNEFDDIELGDANDKQKDKKIDSSRPAYDIDINNLNKKDDLLNDFKIGSDIFSNNKKNTKNNFDSYSGMNILDQIMGGGGRRNNDININSGGTFITGSLNKNVNDFKDKPSVLGDDFKTENKKTEFKESKNEEKQKEKDDDVFDEDFDDFDDI